MGLSRTDAFKNAELRAGDVPAQGKIEGKGFVNHGMTIDGKRFEAALQINEVELNFYTIDAMKQQYGRRLVTDMITSVRTQHQTNEWANYGGQNSSELIRDRHLVECVCPLPSTFPATFANANSSRFTPAAALRRPTS